MRQKNPEFMQEIETFVDQFYAKHHRSPSCREIAANTTLQRSAVQRYLTAMNELGMIRYNGKNIETKKIQACSDGMTSVGIVGSVPCGPLAMEEECIEEYVNLPSSLFGSGSFFLLRAYGDSMVNAGISEGDLVLIRRQEEAQNGEIVVAYVEGTGNTLKRFFLTEDGIVLHPENETLEDMHPDHCLIQGVAVWVFKQVC